MRITEIQRYAVGVVFHDTGLRVFYRRNLVDFQACRAKRAVSAFLKKSPAEVESSLRKAACR